MSDLQLNELGVPGKIWLTIRADDTEHNRRVLEAFRELSKAECKNDYTMSLRKLLEYYEADAKIELLWAAMNAMERRIEELEQFNAKKDDKKERGMF
jgi:hypothetical protein